MKRPAAHCGVVVFCAQTGCRSERNTLANIARALPTAIRMSFTDVHQQEPDARTVPSIHRLQRVRRRPEVRATVTAEDQDHRRLAAKSGKRDRLSGADIGKRKVRSKLMKC